MKFPKNWDDDALLEASNAIIEELGDDLDDLSEYIEVIIEQIGLYGRGEQEYDTACLRTGTTDCSAVRALFLKAGEVAYEWMYHNAASTRTVLDRMHARKDACVRRRKVWTEIICSACNL